MLGDRLAELLAFVGVLDGGRKRRIREADRLARDGEPPAGQDRKRRLEPLADLREAVLFGDPCVIEKQRRGVAGPQAEFVLLFADFQPLGVFRDEKLRHGVGVVPVSLRKEDYHTRPFAVRDPLFRAVYNVPGALLSGFGRHFGGVRPRVGLRKREGADRAALGHRRQPRFPMVFDAELLDTGGRETVDRKRRRDREIAARECLVDDAVGQLIGVEAAVLLGHSQPSQIEIGEAVPDRLRERLCLVGRRRLGTDLPFDEVRNRLLDESPFVRRGHTDLSAPTKIISVVETASFASGWVFSGTCNPTP